MLVASYLGQSAGMAVTAIALAASADFAVVVALATLTTIAIGMTRPAHFALLPALARTADEVTAANVASSTIQNVAILVAPALAGALLAVSGAAAVFGVTAVATGVAAILVATIRTERMELAAPTRPEAAGDGSGPADSDGAAAAATEPDEPEMRLIDGLRLLRSHVGSRTIVLLIGAGSVVEGAIDVIGVVLALDLLGSGDAASAAGIGGGRGGLLGARVGASLVGRRRLAGPLAIGLVVWSAPLAIIGLVPAAAVAVGAVRRRGSGEA